jgi:predicted RNase H-like HicB family nuclease
VKTYVLKVELEQDEDGRWSAGIPALPGCAVWGYTKEEALNSLREAAQAYLEVLFEDGRPLPEEAEETTEVIDAPAVAVIL